MRRRPRSLVGAAPLFLAAALSAAPLGAADRFVAPDGTDSNDCLTPASACLTIAAAVQRSAPGDRVRVAPGGYAENVSIGKSLTILGAGSSLTTVDGLAAASVFDASADGIDVTLAGMTVTNGGPIVGAVHSFRTGGSLLLRDMTLRDNLGHGLYKGGSYAATVVDSVLRDNARAGLFTFSGSATLVRTVVSGNRESGIKSDIGEVTIEDSVISGNSGAVGGGISAGFGPPLVLVNTEVSGNRSDSRGGGIAASAFVLTLTGCTVSGNHADGDGGGIDWSGGGSGSFTNVTFSGNSADGSGGAVSFDASLGGIAALLRNVTVYDNTAASGGGGLSISAPISVTVRNSILAANRAPIGPDCQGTLVSEGYVLLQDGTGCALAGDLTGNRTGDPGLAPLGEHGGGVRTHALLPGSQAIDSGDPAGCVDPTGALLRVDGRGQPRPVACGAVPLCDLGAYEGCVLPAPVAVYGSLDPARVVEPVNVVGFARVSPFDLLAPASGAVVHYQIDDGAGSPALIHLVRVGARLRFFF